MRWIRWIWSREFLLDRALLWLLLVVNGLGDIYAYYWYKDQLIFTWNEIGKWLVLVVPDSPTAILFFTLALVYLTAERYKGERLASAGAAGHVRGFIEAFGVITSIKYGIWAVVMIAAGGLQGDEIVWIEWGLVVGHIGMAVEALLYARFFTYRAAHVAAVAVWTLANDAIDYGFGVFPALPDVLLDDLFWIRAFTICMSLLGIVCAALFLPHIRRQAV